MSGPSYRLEAPRPRAPPPPLNFQPSSHSSTAPLTNYQNSETLLYDLPSSTSMSPPTSPRNKRVKSPSSPSFAGRPTGRRSGRPTPPPSGRNRSITPLGVSPTELEKFAEYCRAWYYEQDEVSGRLMTQTLANVSPSQRAPFSRLQASIRSAYHHSVNARRAAEFQAHLSATQPGGSLMPHSRAAPNSSVAQKERYDRFERFIRSWCTMGMPGTKPFFEALWAVMRLQVIPESIGGGGEYRIEWEFDDAVFKEAAGKDFMLEAIDVLKGFLAFEEAPSLKQVSTNTATYPALHAIHSRSQSQPLPSDKQKPLTIATTAQPKRARAPSDPFLDTPALSHSVGSSSSHSSGNTAALLSTLNSDAEVRDELSSPVYIDGYEAAPPTTAFSYDEGEEEHLRVWTTPDLHNPEFLALLKVFPAFVTRRPLPRFPAPKPRRPDLEEGEDDEIREIHFGTGTLRVSSKLRGDGWQGGWWTRIKLWWRRTFC